MMTRDEIRRCASAIAGRVRRLRDDLDAAEDELTALQRACSHPERRPGLGGEVCADCGEIRWHTLDEEAA